MVILFMPAGCVAAGKHKMGVDMQSVIVLLIDLVLTRKKAFWL